MLEILVREGFLLSGLPLLFEVSGVEKMRILITATLASGRQASILDASVAGQVVAQNFSWQVSTTATSTFSGGFVVGLCVTGERDCAAAGGAVMAHDYDEVAIKDIQEGDEIQSLDEKLARLSGAWSLLAYMGKKQTCWLTTAWEDRSYHSQLSVLGAERTWYNEHSRR